MQDIKFRFTFDNMDKFYYTLDQLLDSSFLKEGMEEEINGMSGLDEDFVEYRMIGKDLCTGLKDSVGIEIYRGDILKWEIRGTIKIAEVVFDVEYGRYIAKDKRNDYYAEAIDFKLCEIIGNIYENKDLLEVSK